MTYKVDKKEQTKTRSRDVTTLLYNLPLVITISPYFVMMTALAVLSSYIIHIVLSLMLSNIDIDILDIH